MTAADALVVDTSAAVAILVEEPGSDWLLDALAAAEQRYMSTGTYLELGIVLESRFGQTGTGTADRFVRDAEIELVEVSPEIAARSLDGWRRFGKGRHPAALNFGDCFAYGLASDHHLPVLCVGEDFSGTDIDTLAPPPASITETS